ncbi:MAG: hypothetical protein JNM80_05885 [Phycisphaerae bacterium]|nr:hypothetical protein [Phycisphaerae bacterium]
MEPPPPPRAVERKQEPSASKFDAELDVCELDDRDRPGPAWAARGRELGRSHLVFRSRRMCYQGRRVLVAVHLIDDTPLPLFGQVAACEYDGEGQYRVELELLRVPERAEVSAWLSSRGGAGGRAATRERGRGGT